LLTVFVNAQKNTDKLKKEQERLEQNIENTKNLLDKTKQNTEATLNGLKLIDNQVKYREQLILNFDNQIRSTELKIDQKNQQIDDLEAKVGQLKEQYKKLVIYAYKKRSKEGQMMFIFSSNSYYEALKRKKYLEKIAEIQRKQKLIIEQHTKLISKEKNALLDEKVYKEKIAGVKRVEKENILKDKVVQTKTLTILKGEEQKLFAQIQRDEHKKQKVANQIQAAIAKEIAIQEEKERKERERLKEIARKNTQNTKKPAGTVEDEKIEPAIVVKTPTFSETKELELNKGFENNKGRLPYPVGSGSITENFGKNAHPTIANVYTNNNGIDISTTKGAQVRAVYEGEVSSVLSIPGAGKIIIIKHGNYRTVYSNLQDVFVSTGSKVSTKQAIGSLLAIDNESISISHFEIHQVIGSQVNRINPSLWIVR
jgi:septal ring factor EnvC (AmiA/AmiB activator)